MILNPDIPSSQPVPENFGITHYLQINDASLLANVFNRPHIIHNIYPKHCREGVCKLKKSEDETYNIGIYIAPLD
jgi:hypothetical protein